MQENREDFVAASTTQLETLRAYQAAAIEKKIAEAAFREAETKYRKAKLEFDNATLHFNDLAGVKTQVTR